MCIMSLQGFLRRISLIAGVRGPRLALQSKEGTRISKGAQDNRDTERADIEMAASTREGKRKEERTA